MLNDTAVRLGVLLVLFTGMLMLTPGVAVADPPCEWDCDDDEDDARDPYFDGPTPDIGGAITEFIGALTPTQTAPVPGL